MMIDTRYLKVSVAFYRIVLPLSFNLPVWLWKPTVDAFNPADFADFLSHDCVYGAPIS